MTASFRIGDFVMCDGPLRQLGIGKLVGVDQDLRATIEYFSSPVTLEQPTRVVHLTILRPVDLQVRTRVYWYDTRVVAWKVGHVEDSGRIKAKALRSADDHYLIRFPNNQSFHIRVPEINVRWNIPVEDPTAYLAAKINESPFLHEGRSRFVRALIRQRALYGGLTALASSSIDLIFHQYEIVRRVLQDPVQRYLLADEVGLGKTIEAGIILRQYILDHPQDHSVLVVAPEHLISQWRSELTDRFHLGDLIDETIHLVSMDDLHEIGRVSSVGLLIVDEAHRVGPTHRDGDCDLPDQYELLRIEAERATRLLLLSATPVLNNEAGFLAMLHLLDPVVYRLDDVAGFRKRVEYRQELAEASQMLDDRIGAFFLADVLDTLDRLLPQDLRLAGLVTATRALVDVSEDDPGRIGIIRALRSHLSETYRLHRRLLRTRREKIHPDLLRGRAGAEVEWYADHWRADIDRYLEYWRSDVSLALFGLLDSPAAEEAHDLFTAMIDAAMSHPSLLLDLVHRRLATIEGHSPDASGVGVVGMQAQTFFEDEPRLLRELVDVLDVPPAADPRMEVLITVLMAQRAAKRKVVVFADAREVADQIAETLRGRLHLTVARHEPGNEAAAQFLTDPMCVALVCDRRSEEGLNLHGVGARIIHFDLPLAPNRIEQRVGRLDRIGAKAPVRSILLAGDGRYERAWIACAVDAVGVFDRSVASLQYVLDGHMQKLRSQLLMEGPEALAKLAVDLADSERGLDAELQRIRAQERLDALESQRAEEEAFLAIDDYELDAEPFEKAVNEWLVGRLSFGIDDHPEDPRAYRYQYRSIDHRTLLTRGDFNYYFGQMSYPLSCIDFDRSRRFKHTSTFPLTYDRLHATESALPLVRLGHPLMDGAWAHARRDDRGIVFAMWRFVPGLSVSPDPFLAFRFDFVVETNLDPVGELLGCAYDEIPHAIRRRADESFPPVIQSIWLDGELELVVDGEVQRWLRIGYDNRGRADGSRDFNLDPTRWAAIAGLEEFVSWQDRCLAARHRAEQEFRQRVKLQQLIAEKVNLLDRAGAVREEQLATRIQSLDGRAREEELRALGRERALAAALIEGIRQPRLRPDAVGAVFLSSHNPFSGTEQ